MQLFKPLKPQLTPKSDRDAISVNLSVVTREVSDEELKQIKAQRKQGRAEWAALGHSEQNRRIIESNRAKAQANRERQKKLGITHYIWCWTPNSGHDCESCASNNGKVFALDTPPKGSHPGDGYCCADGNCKCFAKAIIQGFDS
jgi:uncharacterized protein with gpF-like domain